MAILQNKMCPGTRKQGRYPALQDYLGLYLFMEGFSTPYFFPAFCPIDHDSIQHFAPDVRATVCSIMRRISRE